MEPAVVPAAGLDLCASVLACLDHRRGVGRQAAKCLADGVAGPVLEQVELGELELGLRVAGVEGGGLPQLGQGAGIAPLAHVDSGENRVDEGRSLAELDGLLPRLEGLGVAILLEVDDGQVRVGHPPGGLELDGCLELLNGLVHLPERGVDAAEVVVRGGRVGVQRQGGLLLLQGLLETAPTREHCAPAGAGFGEPRVEVEALAELALSALGVIVQQEQQPQRAARGSALRVEADGCLRLAEGRGDVVLSGAQLGESQACARREGRQLDGASQRDPRARKVAGEEPGSPEGLVSCAGVGGARDGCGAGGNGLVDVALGQPDVGHVGVGQVVRGVDAQGRSGRGLGRSQVAGPEVGGGEVCLGEGLGGGHLRRALQAGQSWPGVTLRQRDQPETHLPAGIVRRRVGSLLELLAGLLGPTGLQQRETEQTA